MNVKDEQIVAQKIRSEYTEQNPSELDALRALDSKVKRPANVFGYVFGSIGAVVMGAGMSLVMTDIGATVGIQNPMFTGIAVGVVGLIMTLVNYPIYKKILKSRKKRYSAEVLSVSEKIINDEKEENVEKIENEKKENEKMSIKKFFKDAFCDMKESAKAQHEVDKAEFQAVKAESKANFEENKFHNTYAKAKEIGKQSWDDAHMSPSERAQKEQVKRDERIAEANARKLAAEERYENAKKK